MNGTPVFGFQPALPLWVLGAITLAGALAIYFSYRRSGLLREVPRLGWTLTILKILALALLILMLAKPQWTREERTKEKADLLVLLDYSESMNIRDAKENVTRFEAARDLYLDRIYPEIENRFNTRAFKFSSFLRPAGVDDLKGRQMADGSATDIGGSLEQAIKGQGGHEAAGVILISDGVHNTGRNPGEVASGLKGRNIPVFAVGVGGDLDYKDVELNETILPELVFEKEKVTIGIDLTAYGYEGQEVSVRVRRTGIAELGKRLTSDRIQMEEIGSKKIVLAGQGFRQRVEFEYRPEQIGDHYLTVDIGSLPGESILANNQGKEILSVVKRQLRVLMVEGSPRWGTGMIFRVVRTDPRFQMDSLTLVNASSGLILPIGPGFLEKEAWGEQPGLRLAPLDPPWEFYDCVLLGDIAPARFKEGSLDKLARRVQDQGMALVFLAGEETYDVQGWGSSPLKNLLPVALAAQPIYQKTATRFVPTAAGLLHPLLDVTSMPVLSQKLWEKMPEGMGFVFSAQPGPGAMVLAEHQEQGNRFGKYPLLAYQMTGKGRVMAMLFDQHWLWSLSRDEEIRKHQVFKQFWRGAIRYLVSGSSEENLKGIHLQLDKDRLARGENLEARAKVYGLDSEEGARVVFQLTGPDGLAEDYRGVSEPSPNPEAGVFFVTQLRPEQIGEYQIAAKLFQAQEQQAEDRATFRVETTAFEHRNAGMNRQLLQSLAASTGGKYYDLEAASPLPDELPEAERTVVRTHVVDLWNSLAVFLLAVILMSAEWIVRKWRDLS